MKRLIMLSVLALVLLPVAFAEEKPRGNEQAIRKLEDDWTAALVKGDIATTDRITTEDWTLVTDVGSRLTRAEANADRSSGALKFESYHLDDLKVRLYGEAAIVSGLETEKSSYKGADTSGQYRFTDVFVKTAGQWRAVATQVTKVVKK